jgi:nicotinate-nucleotide--dimethylbenzimidazole phosphoribosyltransferase
MTDTSPVPGEGLPENTGPQHVPGPHSELPGGAGQSVPGGHHQSGGHHPWSTDAFLAPATPAFTFHDQMRPAESGGLPGGEPAGGEYEDDMLLMPGPQGSWGGEPQYPPQPMPGPQYADDPMGRQPHPQMPQPMTQSMPQPMPQPNPQPIQQTPHPHALSHPEPMPAAGGYPLPGQDGLPPMPHETYPGPNAMEGVMEPVPVEAAAPDPLTDPIELVAPPSAPAPEPLPVPPAVVEPGAPEPLSAQPVGLETVTLPAPPPPVEPGALPEPAPQPAEAAADPSGQPQAVRLPGPTASPESVEPEGQNPPARRPLNLGPPQAPGSADQKSESTGGVSVRSLADRGPTPQPAAPVPPAPPAEVRAEPAAPQPPAPASAEPAAQPAAEAAAPPAAASPAPEPPADEPGGLADLDRAEVPAAVTPEAVEPPAAQPEAVQPESVPPEAVQPPAAQPEAVPPGTPQPDAVQPEAGAGEPAAPAAPDAPAEPVAAAPADAPAQPPAPEPAAASSAELAAGPAESAAATGSAGPGPDGVPLSGYDQAVRDAVHRVIRDRRDIRNGFRSDPIPPEVLLRVLEAAHTAPSVGHSQPWDFVVIRSEKTREKMHELAMKQREAYANSLPKARARQFRELKIEAILDTPVNIVVTADPTRGGRHTLGRHTQPQMAPYSSALAVENLWLAARAEGLGVGWVSFFDEREMVRELGLPEHLEVVAYLCVGYVDEFPEEPELVQAGWSKRRPLAWVVHEEEYGNRALPGEAPHDLLEETLRGIRPLDAKALGEAWERQKRMTKPAGALGMLEIISAQLSGLSRQCPPPIPEPAVVAIFAGDHGVHAQGVTPWPQEVTGQMVANFLGGGAVCNAFANQVGAEVCVVDVGVAAELPTTPGLLPRKVRPGTDDFTAGPAMSREDALHAIEVGIETARDLVAAGNKVLLTGEMGIANTTASAALISVFTGADPTEVTGRGTGINDEMHARKIDVVRRALELHHPDPSDPIGVLTAVGGLEHAAIVGLVLGGASLRTPVILDGVSAGAAALVARAIAPEALAACIAGHRSAEPGHLAALTKLGLRPLVDLDLRLGEGTGALLALPLVQSAARVMHEVATFDAAGVTEKA